MKRWIHASLILFLLISVVLFDTTVFANSSWQWISETRPFDLLPIVAVATIFIETAAINWGGNVHRLYKVFGMNILANMVSFLVPYLLNWADQVTHMKYPVFSAENPSTGTPFIRILLNAQPSAIGIFTPTLTDSVLIVSPFPFTIGVCSIVTSVFPAILGINCNICINVFCPTSDVNG